MKRYRITIGGQVQGVGCRPFIYRLARRHGLTGFVHNDVGGVTIEVQGPRESISGFEFDLQDRAAPDYPPLLKIAAVSGSELSSVAAETEFKIILSQTEGDPVSQVTPDMATCRDCLSELVDPSDFRYRYPFINCTHCGPRYSIIEKIPYDRPNTTMAAFAMCPRCAGQYADVADRRFHAQPVACPQCGPRITLCAASGEILEAQSDSAISRCAESLRQGGIAAIKGIGGFHLAVDAKNDAAVQRLRHRKRRDAKPFALMARSIDEIRKHSLIGDLEKQLLTSPAAPIVLLDKRLPGAIAPSAAFGTNRFGFMLPYAPLHHLLFAEEGIEVLVMTSANLADEPLICDNEQALEELADIADVFLLHDRDIFRQLDDSVLHIIDARPAFLRRARGYVPSPVYRAEPAAVDILATGPDLKNTFCFVKKNQYLVSEHIGDLADGRVYRHYVQSIERLSALFDVRPQIVACDLHPGYLSTYYAEQLKDVQLIRVQHHWAHAASVLADTGKDGPVIALIADGTGYGTDGAIWGCECLIASLTEFKRLAHLAYYPLAGGDKAAKEAIRPLLGLIDPSDSAAAGILQKIEPDADKINLICTQIEKKLNVVPASSLGRLFDAAAALIGLGVRNRFEAELPMALESIAADGIEDHYPVELIGTGGVQQWGYQPVMYGMIDDLNRGTDAGVIAARFHNTVAAGLLSMAHAARAQTGLAEVAFSGGVFCNRYLANRLIRLLHDSGFSVLWKKSVPVNDGGVSLGQAAIAARMLEMGLIGK